MRKVRLSIITINLNNAAGLRKTIESVVKQNSEEFEYIVIDGGSTDGSVEVVREYEANIDYWVSQPDRGIYHAMNKGIALAKGEYCQFLNSGDYLYDADVTTKMLSEVNGSGIIYGNKVKLVAGKEKVDKSFFGRKVTLYDMYRGTFYHATTYISKSLFEKYGLFDESLKIVSDWKFFLITLGLHSEQTAYKDINVVYFDTNGISSTQKQLLKKERDQVLSELLPESILRDYDYFSKETMMLKKIKKYQFFWTVVHTTYLLINKIEVILNKNKHEKIFD